MHRKVEIRFYPRINAKFSSKISGIYNNIMLRRKCGIIKQYGMIIESGNIKAVFQWDGGI